MGALRLLVTALALLVGSPAQADAVDRWQGFIADASARLGIPTAWIERVMRAESAGFTTRNGRPITSSAGAMGLMQLMPGTWIEMRGALRLGADPHDPRDNILAGTYYLRLMYDRFGYPGCFAAYNAGPARYADHLATGRRLPGETTAYLRAVTGAARTHVASLLPPQPRIFAIRPITPSASTGPRAGTIFFPLSRGNGPSPGKSVSVPPVLDARARK